LRILSKEEISRIYSDFLANQEKNNDFKSAYFYHLGLLNERLEDIRNYYPNDALHAVAIKTNNLPGVLENIVAKGCGLEAASFEEVLLAVKAQCPTDKIVFDSPVKTQKEIDYCDSKLHNLRINANSFHELKKLKKCNNLVIGIRVNPMIEIEAPEIFNVSGIGSKFGIPITYKEELLNAIIDNSHITGIHVHPGSEIKNLKDHISSISAIVDFAKWINEKTDNQIKWIDIGGGVKADLENDAQKSISNFAEALKENCPSLFSDFQIITEYGRFVHQHCAFGVSKIEDVLDYDDQKILLIHLGADMYLREVYSANPPAHNYYGLDSYGKIKNGEIKKYDIGGPLCFSGDFLAKNYELPHLDIGDSIAIDMSGANSISMWSSHCSRTKPEVIYVD